MSQADLTSLRSELAAIQQQTRRSRRWAVLGFVILVFALIISSAYGFVQGVEASKQRESAYQQQQLAESAKVEADRSAQEAIRQQAIAIEAQAQLEECRNKKK